MKPHLGKVDLTQTTKEYQHKSTLDESKTSAAKKGSAFGSVKMASWTMVAMKNTNLTKNNDDEDLARKDSIGSNKGAPDLSLSQMSKQRTQLVGGAS